jgi:formylglycine-generating enzyme required for sulfatase activity
MKKALVNVFSAVAILGVSGLFANNIQVGTVVLQNQDVSAGANNAANFTEIKFDLSWENSWRLTTGPGNWDAAWIFAKYRIGTGDYRHAHLSTNAAHHSFDAGTSSNPITITPSADGLGVFVYMTNAGTASLLDIKDLTLRWNYRANSLAPVGDNDQVTVQVFAVEMVYVPQGSFYIGDGNQTTTIISNNAFRKSNNSGVADRNDAVLISSEGAIDFVNATGVGAFDPISTAAEAAFQAYRLPAQYPKGFRAFYCMKYDVTVRQYVDFFNTLPTTGISRQNRRPEAASLTSYTVTNHRQRFSWPGTAASDATVNTAANSSGWVGMQGISVEDALTYMDWAALRPMTELEYEKACRGHDIVHGPLYPIPQEYAWGNTSINGTGVPVATTTAWTSGTHVVNPSNATETPGSTTFTTWWCNYAYAGTSTGTVLRGPVRAGFFASKNPFPATDPRRNAGASYYGIMELTGNLAKLVISTAVRNSSGTYSLRVKPSSYTGQHGDGELDADGRFNQSNWTYPKMGAQLLDTATADGGMNPMLKGGHYRTSTAIQMAVSHRPNAFYTSNNNTTQTQITSNLCGVDASTAAGVTLTFTTKTNLSTTTASILATNLMGIRAVRTAP